LPPSRSELSPSSRRRSPDADRPTLQADINDLEVI